MKKSPVGLRYRKGKDEPGREGCRKGWTGGNGHESAGNEQNVS